MEKSHEIKIGLEYRNEEMVTKGKTAAAMGSGLLNVYSTPAMIAFMEKTAYESIEPHLLPHEGSVGSEVNIKHLRPTPVGMDVHCISRVLEVKERKVVFKVEVFDEKGKIGEGLHVRYVIDKQRFMSKI